MNTILVTGGCGFVGRHLIRMILDERPGVRVRNLDALTYSGHLENTRAFADHPDYEFVRGDVTDAAACRSALVGCDAVLHVAAESHVDRSIADPRPFVLSNTLGTQMLLEAWRTGPGAEGKRFVNVSTDEVYGDLPLNSGERFAEECPHRPRSAYAASKSGADLMARAYFETFGLNVVTTRSCNNLGPYQFPEKLIPVAIGRLLEGANVPLYGDGLNVRDWMHVEDHCSGILAALDHGEAGEAYNLAAGNERSNLEMARSLVSEFGLGDNRIEFIADRPGHDRRYAVDATRAKRELNWVPKRSAWPDSLRETIGWYRANTDWAATVLAAARSREAERR